MKRIVCRVEGNPEYTYKLAMLVLKNVFINQGVELRPMYVSNEEILEGTFRGLIASDPIIMVNRYTSFLQAQKSIENSIVKGINALLMTDCFLNWECPGDRLNEALDLLESYLRKHEVSVILLQNYSERVPLNQLQQVCGAMALKQSCLDASDHYNEIYCGEEFVLPYGVLPAFFINKAEKNSSRTRLNIRYLTPFY